MKKLKKGERVRNYLLNLINTGRINKLQLFALKTDDLASQPELTGIGKRTVLNMLKQIKFELYPDEWRHHQISKKERVSSFLETLLVDEKFDAGMIRSLSYKDLINEPDLQGIGKTTITCSLGEFKQQHVEPDPEESFNVNVHPRDNPTRNKKYNQQPAMENQKAYTVKSFINKYGKGQELVLNNEVFELRELKMALHYMGINHKRLLRAYYEDISRFRMTRLM